MTNNVAGDFRLAVRQALRHRTSIAAADTANLFVPFYTTKRDGSGSGLVLSRQIAEAHGDALTFANRPDRSAWQRAVIRTDYLASKLLADST